MSEQPNAAVESGSGAAFRQVLTLRIGADVYAVDLLEVSELRRWNGAVRVPNAPPCVLGVMNVRGAIVPVIELRQRLGVPPGEYGNTSVVVLLSVDWGAANRTVGLLVDGVEDVIELGDGALRPTPEQDGTEQGDTHDVVAGMFKASERTGVLLVTEVLVRDALPNPGVGSEARP